MNTNLLIKLLLFAFTLLSFTNCKTEYPSDEVFQNKAQASLISSSNQSKEKTADLIQGVWTSNQGGSKYKWVFEGDKLLKNNIYSFGEVGKPIDYKMQFLDGFNGELDDAGKFIFIQLDNENNGITYQILKVTEKNIVLGTKFNETIVLER